MEINRFDDQKIPGKDRYFKKPQKISQQQIDSFNQKGYKLYYYKDFNLIEITNIKDEVIKIKNKIGGDVWNNWGTEVFFLDEQEYNLAMKGAKTSKDLYDLHIEKANLFKQTPMSAIYHHILKVDE